MGDKNFELCTGLITMVQANSFCGLPREDADSYLQHFLELCNTIVIKDVTLDVIRLSFSLLPLGEGGVVVLQGQEAVSTWSKCSTVFLAKFFPMVKTNALSGRISNFQQNAMESIPEVWESL